MANEEIKLSPEELEEVKDTVAFRVKVAITLKQILKDIDKFSHLPDRINKLDAHSMIQWFFLGGLVLTLIIRLFHNFMVK